MSLLPGLPSLVGFGGAGGQSIVHTATSLDILNRSQYTRTGIAIGEAASDRFVVVGVLGDRNSGTPSTLTSVTIGGITAPQIVTRGNDSLLIRLVGVVVPTGATADIVMTFGQGQKHCGISVWALYGLDSTTAEDTGSDLNSQPLTDTLVTTVGGMTVAFVYYNQADTWTWGADLTEVHDEQWETFCFSAAMDASAPDTSLDVSAEATGGFGIELGVWATWN